MALVCCKQIVFACLGYILFNTCDSFSRSPVISPFGSNTNFLQAQKKAAQSKDKVKLLGPVLRNQIAHFRQKGKVDLVFLVDGSGSVGHENFVSEIRFVTKLLADFIVDEDTTRVAVVVYSSQKRVYRYVDYITTPGADKHKCRLLNNDLPQIEYHGGGTYTLGAFQNAKDILRFGRQDAQKVIILITDGYSNGGDPRPEASSLKKDGVLIFTFGIKNGNVQELVDMASDPKNETAYILTSFEEFEQLARRALHEDLRGGSILPQRDTFCNHLCPEGRHCCNKKAECVCGTHTGHFECLCPPGYYGSGIGDGCSPCPSGTYKPKSVSGDIGTCIACPNEENHVTEPGATSINQCVCKKGYLSTYINGTGGDCSVLTCPRLDAPKNGYFVNKKCNNVYNAACGLRCEPGFELIGSSLRICEENGTWSGTETLCLMKTCPPLPRPKHGNMICDNEDFMFATVCRFTCDTGYKLVGSRKRTCLAIAQWTGITTRCREITCQPLPPLKDGFITDSVSGSSKCTGVDAVSFGTTCQMSCAHGYKLLGPHTKQCTPDGLWVQSSEDDINQCIDTSAPFILCPNNINTTTDLDKSTARVTWTTPVPVDNSGYIPIVTSLPAVTSPADFPIGTTIIVYTAEDLNKNKNSCSFKITVTDDQKPTVDRCFSPFPVVSVSEYINVTWEAPIFSDNSDLEMKVIASHEQGLFPKGKTEVTYTAFDEAGNNNTCQIEITVLPHPCELPEAPANGLIQCVEENDGVRCNVSCMIGYAFALEPAKSYFCAYDNVWRPKKKMPIPDCSVKILSNEVEQSTSVTFSGSLSCQEGRLLHNVERELESKITNRVDVLCEDNVECSVSGVETTCADSINFNKIDVLPRRLRRSLLEVRTKENSDPDEEDGNSPTSQLTFDFTLQGSVNASGNHMEDYKRQQLAKENLQTIIRTLKQDAKSGHFNVEMQGKKIAFTDMVLGSKDPAYRCPTGKVLVDDSCVNCPIGTFYNVISRKCQNCGVGTYQTEEGKSTCSVCPKHKSTHSNRTRSLDECKDLCLPGTFSEDGLERCETCHVGYFQSQYGKKSCIRCPGKRTTLKRGSRRKSFCKFRCPAGHVSKTGLRPCYPCPKGTFQPEEGKSLCFECFNGTTTDTTASTNVSDCKGDGIDVMLADEEPLGDGLIVNECFNNPCKNSAECTPGIFGYECACLPGYTGDNCEVIINMCDAKPCLNGGVCYPQVNAYTCKCVIGFTGQKCEKNIDDCIQGACFNGGTCVDGVSTFKCSCPVGFEGKRCDIELDECTSKPCQNGGKCISEVAGYSCDCSSGFTGSNCEVDIDECASNPCHNEATCVDQNNQFSCICASGYTGTHCETDINECSDLPCQNGGTCVDLIGKYKCLCLPGFTGKKCSQELSNNFQLDFTGSTVDYARLQISQSLSAVTVAFWVNTDDTDNYGTPFSYAVGSNENALKLHDYNGFTVYVNGGHVVTDVQVNDGRWHHIALTWSKNGGIWRLYLDGKLVEDAVGLSSDKDIPGGGVFIIGQEQDTPGGGFDSRESFIGSLAHLNVWDRELPQLEIQASRFDCSKSIGNVIAWTDVLAGLRGSLKKIPSTFCTECLPPLVPDIGKLNLTGVVPGSRATFTCPKGFLLKGQAVRRCLINGEWGGESAYCEIIQCGRPNLIYGKVEGGRFSFDNRVRYRCLPGYKLIGPSTSYCSHTGVWLPEGVVPRCEKIVCVLPSLSRNTRVLNFKEQYVPGDNAQFACTAGYNFVTSHNTLRCKSDSNWDNKVPTCDHTTCPDPSGIEYGSLQESNTQYTVGTDATYTCYFGYTFESSRQSMTCLPEGVWETPYPRCVVITCPAPPTIEYADISRGDPKETTFLSRIDFQCWPGYESEVPLLIECLEDAKWTTPLPKCKPVECGRPDGIAYGTLQVSSHTFNSVALYRCNTGYRLLGDSTRTCLEDRTWSGNAPRCTPLSCDQPPFIDNGYFTGSDFLYEQVINYFCDEGYQFPGVSTMSKTCSENGIWEGEDNACVPITCPVPVEIRYGGWRGDTVFVYRSTITYYCNGGYSLQGEDVLTCQSSGSWSSTFPSCNPVSCFDPPPIINGIAKILGYTYASKVEYRCNSGFTLSGADVIVCQADGTWSDNAPLCIAQRCPPLTNITNGIVTYNAMNVGSLAAYICNLGYERMGPEIRQCLSSLSWSDTEPTCEIISCPPLDDITHGRVTVESYTYKSAAEYECNEGYRLEGTYKRFCQADKTWSSLAPICDRVKCDPLPTSIKNGLAIGRSYYYSDTVEFSCNDGYRLVGDSVTTCQANGVWSSGVPFCEIVRCPPLELINGKLSSTRRTYASTIKLSCNSNFRLVGPEHTFCQADGRWTSASAQCVEINCPVLNDPINGRVEMSGRLTAMFYCDEGHLLRGEQQLTCLVSNVWDSEPPTCIPLQCEDLGELSNGQIILTDGTNYLSRAQYTCDIGYGLSGEPRICESNGQWSGAAPSCKIKTCHQPQPLINGGIEGAEFTFGSMITFYCDAGYQLNGQGLLICLDTERWSGNPPVCERVTCKQPERLPNGRVIGESYHYGDVIKHQCDSGYELRGDTSRTCSENKSWSGERPACVLVSCLEPERIENGKVSGTSYTFGSMVKYTCDEGYSLTGSKERECLETQNWSKAAPTCHLITCEKPESISYGRIVGNAYTYGSQIEYICDVGYSLFGNDLRNCLKTSKWSGGTPTCIIKQCPVPEVIENGVFSGSNFTFGSFITYHCNEGYDMIGSDIRLCLDTAEWSGATPSCNIISCTTPESVNNGRILGSDYTYRATIEYKCNEGYQLRGESSRLCKQNGLWSGIAPSCDIVSCSDPGTLENGYVIGNTYTYRSILTYTCNEGYDLQGDSIRECNADGLWSSRIPNCIIRYCPVPQSIENGVYHGSSYSYDSQITYNCNTGYRMEGNSERTCLSSQAWSGSLPSCHIVTCQPPQHVPNGRIVGSDFNYGDVIKYMCDVGYELSGTNSRSCQDDGSWSGTVPDCFITFCPVPKSITNGEIIGMEYTFGSTLTYECSPGYQLVGDSFRLCMQTKSWSGTDPSCVIIDCGSPGAIHSGMVVGSVYTYGGVVKYSCDEGYTLEGEESRVCQDSGHWSGETPRCLIVNCPVPLRPENGGIGDSNYLFGSTIDYFCDEGYDLLGDATRICLSGKQWSGDDPACQIIVCEKPDSPNNGIFIGTDFAYRATVRYQCDDGYELEGPEERTCMPDKVWSPEIPLCVEIRCDKPNRIVNGNIYGENFSYDSEINYECDEGYDLVGKASRRCTASKTWSGDAPSCAILSCPEPDIFLNGTIIANNGLNYGSTIEYQCDEGFEMRGEESRTCLSSKVWDIDAPVCEVITCPTPNPVINGAFIGRSRNFGDIIGYKCNTGYDLHGEKERVCMHDGQWSSEEPVCNPVDCGYPDIDVDHIKARLLTGTTTLNSPVIFTCDEGYTLLGFGYARCTESGSWSMTQVSCERVYCPRPGTISHGNIDGTSFYYGDTITINCDMGYVLDGDKSITCLSNGRWDRVLPSCKPVECLYPEELTNGYFEGQSFIYGETIEYFCNDKYRMIGDGMRRCESTGHWTGKIPSCELVICETPAIVPNGIVAESYMTVYTHGDELSYHCTSGYTLVGPSTIRCELTGEWSHSPPHCDRSECPRPTDLLHGAITGEDFKYQGVIAYDCDSGYTLLGDSERVCLDTGDWSGHEPTCNIVTCKDSVSIDNARVTGLKTFGSTITYQCDEGFVINGETNLNCLASGEWDSDFPTCNKIECPAPPSLSNGYIDGASYEYSSEIAYICQEGFSLNGNDRRVCQSNGEWSGTDPTCERNKCEKPLDIANGHISGDVYEYGSIIKYICNDGYSLRGSRSRVCEYDGKWDGIQPHCRIKSCPIITDINNGDVVGETYDYGSIVTFKCDNGYYVEGSSAIVCLADGSWNTTEPYCKRRLCEQLPDIPNGGLKNRDFLYNDEVTFYCDEGYELIGDVTTKCTEDGTWLNSVPSCALIHCPTPPEIDFGVRTGEDFNFQDMVYYSCIDGYELEGNNLLQCNADGEWNGPLPTCIPVMCEMPPVIPRATTIVSRLTFGSVVTYNCNPGYRLEGDPTAQCNVNRTWMFDKVPSCLPIDCGSLADISNGYKTGSATTFGSTVYFGCDEGYTLAGTEITSCTEDGTWSSTTPTCQPINCGRPELSEHTLLQGEDFTFGKQVSMECQRGYILEGNHAIICMADGSWSSEFPKCQPVQCEKPSLPDNVVVTSSGFNFGERINFACPSGYTLTGPTVLICEASAFWSGRVPDCVPIVCGEPNVQDGVQVMGKSFSFNDRVEFTCGAGYNMVGSRTAVCQENGQWSDVDQRCHVVECDTISLSEHVVVVRGDPSIKSSYNTAISFACKSGYELSGDDSLVCSEDGTWIGTHPTCHRIGPLRDSCDTTLELQHSETILPGFMIGDRIEIGCVTGYEPSGNMTSICQSDRTWSKPAGHCTRVFCGKPIIRDMINVWGMSGRSFYYGDHVRFRCRPGLRPSRDPPMITCTETGRWNSDIYCTGRCKFGCLNGGMCVGLNRCKCPHGYAGRRCEQAICIFPCMNGGKCVAPYQCQCHPGYRGHRCQIKTR